MSAPKFTPGPWRVTGGTAAIEIRESVPGAMHRIARVLRADRSDLDVSHANARLIAAAPELYEALRALLDGPIRHEVREGYEAQYPQIAAALAALAKVQS